MADEIIRLDYSAEDIGDNIDEVRTARGTFDTLDDRLDNIEGGGPSPSNPIASNCVSPMTGYSKSSSSTPGNISTDDTLNAAIGKLEKRTELNENNILFTATIGECESTGDTANKVVTVSDVNYTPHKGSIIAVKFKYGNSVTDTAEHPITLNVNNTGAYRIWYKNGDYANASQGKVFGLSGYYIYYMYDGVDRWVWINYCMDNTYSLLSQAEASAGTATNEHLINAKVLSDTIDEKLVPVENNISLLTQYGGGRNVLSASQVTKSSSVVNIETIPAGTYKFHCDTDEPAHWALKFRNASNTDIYVVESAGAMGPNSAITVTLTEDAVKISPWWQSPGNGLKNMYLCRESDWTTPYVYQPYAMSNAELTAAIQALQAQLNQ